MSLSFCAEDATSSMLEVICCIEAAVSCVAEAFFSAVEETVGA